MFVNNVLFMIYKAIEVKVWPVLKNNDIVHKLAFLFL